MKSMASVNYSGSAIPEGYVCINCGASGCRLWRQYSTFLEHIDLLCRECATAEQAEALAELASERIQTDTIGWRVPAVPTEDGSTFWGYTSVPQPGVEWWYRLPDRPGDALRVRS